MTDKNSKQSSSKGRDLGIYIIEARGDRDKYTAYLIEKLRERTNDWLCKWIADMLDPAINSKKKFKLNIEANKAGNLNQDTKIDYDLLFEILRETKVKKERLERIQDEMDLSEKNARKWLKRFEKPLA